MGLSWVLQAWAEWQLRVLVFGSFFLHSFLFFAAELRKFAIPFWLRLCVWLAYLGSDGLAVYALATLFNRYLGQHCCAAAHGGHSGTVEAMWAPILLVHLGGQDNITAYNIEDNELWARHVLTLLSQVTVAIYVFWKAWPPVADGKLLAASVLLFLVGFLKFSEKPRALKHASFHSLASSSTVVKNISTPKEGDIPLEVYVERAKKCVENRQQKDEDTTKEAIHKQRIIRPYELFVDLAAPYSRRLSNLEYFLKLDDKRAFKVLQAGFCNTFDLLYSKERALVSSYGLAMRLLVFLMILASLCLFAMTHKHGRYNKSDVKLTYMLLITPVVTEFFTCWRAVSHLDNLFNYRPRRVLGPMLQTNQERNILIKWLGAIVDYLRFLYGQSAWSHKVAQYNLVKFFAYNKKHTLMMCIAELFGCKNLADRLYVDYCYSSDNINELILGYVKDGWKNDIHDPVTYRSFIDRRGQGTLCRKQCYRQLGWSIKVPFDRSVLLWHIATDLCFLRSTDDKHVLCREMSNYMIYLLFICPEMLMASTRKDLFTAACDELELIFKDSKAPLKQEKLKAEIFNKFQSSQEGAQKNLDKVQSSSNDAIATGGIIHDSCKLAKELEELGTKEKWDVISGVWVEMLCYSAGKSKGYLHAKSLGTGGEYLSYVWLLLSHMGMETLGTGFKGHRFLKKTKKKKLLAHRFLEAQSL